MACVVEDDLHFFVEHHQCVVDDRLNVLEGVQSIVGGVQRLDLRKSKTGSSLALVPNKVGLVTARRMGKTRTYKIGSADMCLKIRVHSGGCSQFEGWVADGILFFKPMESEDK